MVVGTLTEPEPETGTGRDRDRDESKRRPNSVALMRISGWVDGQEEDEDLCGGIRDNDDDDDRHEG